MLQLNPPAFVLERRINQPLRAVHSGLRAGATDLQPDTQIKLGAQGVLCLDTELTPVLGSYDLSWRAEGRLLSPHRRLVARVEIVVDGWSTDATRLSLRPRTNRPQRWGRRRLGRYFRLAHAAADRIADSLKRSALPAEPKLIPQLAGIH